MAGSCIVEIVKIMDQGPVVHRVKRRGARESTCREERHRTDGANRWGRRTAYGFRAVARSVSDLGASDCTSRAIAG